MSRDNLLRPFYGQAHLYTVSHPVTCLDILHSSVTLKIEAAGYLLQKDCKHVSEGRVSTPKPKIRSHGGIFTTAVNVLPQFKPHYE